MKTVREIENYIERTRMTKHAKDHYDMTSGEMQALFDILLRQKEPWAALSLAFALGQARGYRAAKCGR